MGKNSTPEKSTLDKEKYKDEINSLRDDMQRLKDEVQAIRVAYPWGPEYDAELLRLIDVCREKHSYRSFLAEFNKNEWFDSLRRGGFYAPSDTIAYIAYAVAFINAHLGDLRNVLADRGEQGTLFTTEEETPPEKARMWRRYQDKPADVRRLELLAQRVLLEAAESEIDAWLTPNAPRRNLRTKSRAGAEVCSLFSTLLATPTREGARNALSCIAGSGAYLQNARQDVKNIGELAIRQGRFFIAGEGRAAEERDLEELVEDGKIKAEDTVLMAAFYSVCWARYEEKGEFGEITVYAPDFMRYIGALPKDKAQQKKIKHNLRGASTAGIEKFVQRAASLNNLIGVLPGKGLYAAFLLKNYDKEKNTITFESPYIDRIIEDAKRQRLALEEKAKITKKAKKKAIIIPPENAYLIEPNILTAKNAVAIVNVFNIVRLIETAGPGNVPHITYRNLIKQNTELSDRLQQSKNCSQLLKRVFCTTWEYLEEYTRLKEKYPTIVFPDKNTYPTMSTLNDVISFPHPSEEISGKYDDKNTSHRAKSKSTPKKNSQS